MRIGVIGASGFIGRVFCQLAVSEGHQVVAFSRRSKPDSAGMTWRVFNEAPDMSGLDAVVNYAGESVAQRWSESKKKEFYTSRVGVTQKILAQIKALPEEERPSLLVNSSAVGYYGDCGDRELDESSPLGSGYLAQLCADWEAAAMEGRALGLRVVVGRIGIVLGEGGAAWQKMRTAFLMGAGGPLGSGTHWMPWVHVGDVAGATLFAIENSRLEGAVNFVSPDPRTNRDFTKALAKSLNRPAFLPAPAFALQLVFGEFGKHLLDSYRVVPKVLKSENYPFKYEVLEKCLNAMNE